MTSLAGSTDASFLTMKESSQGCASVPLFRRPSVVALAEKPFESDIFIYNTQQSCNAGLKLIENNAEITQPLAQTIAPPLLYLLFPELETLTELVEVPKLLVVAGYDDGIPRVAGSYLEIRVDLSDGFDELYRPYASP